MDQFHLVPAPDIVTSLFRVGCPRERSGAVTRTGNLSTFQPSGHPISPDEARRTQGRVAVIRFRCLSRSHFDRGGMPAFLMRRLRDMCAEFNLTALAYSLLAANGLFARGVSCIVWHSPQHPSIAGLRCSRCRPCAAAGCQIEGDRKQTCLSAERVHNSGISQRHLT